MNKLNIGTGALVGGLLTAALMGIMYLGNKLVGLPFVPFDLFAGDADEYVDLNRLDDWPGAAVHVIDGANHTFAARLGELETSIRDALSGLPIRK